MTPDLTAVICTYNRPDLLRRALAAVDAQTLSRVDRDDHRLRQERPGHCRSSATPVTGSSARIRNARTPGLPGARNTGFGAASAPVIALCDDDDAWGPEKTAHQLALLDAHPEIDVVFSGMRAMTDKGPTIRIPDSDRLTLPMLLADRVADAHISSAMFRRDALFDRIGLFDEQIPGGYCEDYEWTLRAARATQMAVVREPLVDIRWGTGSYFSDRWRTIDDALGYLLDEFPEFATNPRAASRVSKASRRSRAPRRVTARKRGRRSARRCATTGASPGPTSPRSSRPGWPSPSGCSRSSNAAVTASEPSRYRARRETAGLP